MASLSSLLADLLRVRAIHLARFDAGMQKRIIAHLKTLERQIVAKISELEYFGELTPNARAGLEATLTWSRATIDATYQRIDRQATTELRDLAAAEAKWIESRFDGALGVKLIDTAMSPTGLAAIVDGTMVRGNPSEDWWAGQSLALQRKFAGQMRLGLTAGESISDLIVRIRGNDNTAGIMDASRREVAALVRTSVQSVANETRMQIYKQNDDVVGALQHVSTLDDRTSDICKARDGLQWKMDGEPIGHSIPFERPPLHWNCRSTVVPVTKTWQQMGFNISELTPTQRASMDGAVPADMTYEEWLKTKSIEFQDRVLGPGKAELWREGSISLRDLLDQSGRPLTLDQLEALATERDLADLEPPGEGVSSAVEAPDRRTQLEPSGDVDQNGRPLIDFTGTDNVTASHRDLADYIDADDLNAISDREYASKVAALKGYSLTHYNDINKVLRDPNVSDNLLRATKEDVRGWVTKIDSLFSPAREDYLTYRGVNSSRRYAAVQPGSIVELSGLTSTSRSYSIGEMFTGSEGALWEISVPKGTPAIVFNAKEAEIVLKHGQKLRVVEVIRKPTLVASQWSEKPVGMVIKAEVVNE